MKKFIILGILTAALSILILTAGQAVKNSMIQVTAIKILPSTADDVMVCSGKVESLDDSKVYAPSTGVTKKVYVKTGDKVSSGQPLMDVITTSSSYNNFNYQNAYEAYTSYLNSSGASSEAGETQTVETLTSPVSGTVESVAATEKNCVLNSSDPAVVIKNGSGMQVRLSVGESQISQLKVGQKAEITGVGFKNSIYSGVVENISDEAKQTVTTTGQETVVDAIVSIQDPGIDIKSGFTAKAKIITSHCTNALIIPYEAVREDDNGNEYVYRIVNQRAVKTSILTGKELDSGFEVKQGISANDIVIQNPDKVYNGAHVVPTVVRAVDLDD